MTTKQVYLVLLWAAIPRRREVDVKHGAAEPRALQRVHRQARGPQVIVRNHDEAARERCRVQRAHLPIGLAEKQLPDELFN